MECDIFDVSEGIYINKTSKTREYIIFHYWYFLRIDFRFQSKVCNDCHHMTQKYMSFNDVLIVTAGRNDYRINFWGIAKCAAVNRTESADLSEKSNQL